MLVITEREVKPQFSADAGIAIGPILFIIAVLGILASAIAAGSGSFTTSTSGESNRTKAAAIIEIGQNLKAGFDRALSVVPTPMANVVIGEANTSNNVDLFSPLGGGIAPPSGTMQKSGAEGWHYYYIKQPHLGTNANNGNRVAVLEVDEGVCLELNAKLNGLTTMVTAADAGDLKADDDEVIDNSTEVTNWPAALSARPAGCINNTNAGATGYFFYQVIGVD